MSVPPRLRKTFLLWALATAVTVLASCLALEVHMRGIFAD